MKSSIFYCFFFLLLNCGDRTTSVQNDTKENKSKTQQQEITKKAIESLEYDDYVLSEEAEKKVSNWREFQELSTQISFLKKADLSFFESDKQILVSLISDLKANIPEALNTNPIHARIIVVETKLFKLQNNLTLDNITTEEKLESIKELLVAISNLNIQMNKKLEFDLNEVERPQ